MSARQNVSVPDSTKVAGRLTAILPETSKSTVTQRQDPPLSSSTQRVPGNPASVRRLQRLSSRSLTYTQTHSRAATSDSRASPSSFTHGPCSPA